MNTVPVYPCLKIRFASRLTDEIDPGSDQLAQAQVELSEVEQVHPPRVVQLHRQIHILGCMEWERRAPPAETCQIGFRLIYPGRCA